jgi:membrane-associated phospholipid phosphatase
VPCCYLNRGTGLLGRALKAIKPNKRPFSLQDPGISYPFTADERVPSLILYLISILAPAVIIAGLSLLFVPGRNVDRPNSKQLTWRRKFWEWNVGWMGLGIAFAGVYAATEGLKIIVGKPRPDLLSRCDPDLSNIAAHIVGGLGANLTNAPLVVSWTICQNTSSKLSRDGFVGFPSGHASGMCQKKLKK